jgi:prepilin-type N-terminal cleavage/methylation domain-containing protein
MIKNQKSKIKNKKGFTLIELLIFMGIFSVLIVVLFQMFTAIFDVQLESQSTSAVAQDGRYILNKLTYDIKNITNITVPAVGSTSASLVISDGVTTYTYTLNNGNLSLNNSTLGTTDSLNSVNTTVTSISFLRLSDTASQNKNTITVNFTLNSRVSKRSGVSSESFRLTAGTR